MNSVRGPTTCNDSQHARVGVALVKPQLTRILSWGFSGAACGNRTHDLFITRQDVISSDLHVYGPCSVCVR
nr:MAG TPA: hypothetical protein [Caudoviricetes sp.]